MAGDDSDIQDMEDERTPAQVSEVDEVYERLSHARFLDLPPEADTNALAVYVAFNPDLTEG